MKNKIVVATSKMEKQNRYSVILLPDRMTEPEAWQTPIAANDRMQSILAICIILVGPRRHPPGDVRVVRDSDAIDALVVALGLQLLQGERAAFLRTSSYSCYI
jgi:hypothetical protein